MADCGRRTNNGGSMPEKGPPVYLDYDQAALDAAYDQAAYAPNREQLIKRRIRDSELARLRIGEPERVAYGPAEIERLDIYRTGRTTAPVFVFIHGGAWRSGRSKDFAAPAEMFLAAGAHYVVPDFGGRTERAAAMAGYLCVQSRPVRVSS
jgi:arylformamidase